MTAWLWAVGGGSFAADIRDTFNQRMQMKSCDTCIYWEDFGPGDDGRQNDGSCHRFPPVRYNEPNEDSETPVAQLFQFPVTWMKNWCGEWKLSETARSPVDEMISPNGGPISHVEVRDIGIKALAERIERM